jgi:hypothetical protein
MTFSKFGSMNNKRINNLLIAHFDHGVVRHYVHLNEQLLISHS